MSGLTSAPLTAADIAALSPPVIDVDAAIEALAIGWGQNWDDVETSRNANTSYQNTTGKPICVNVRTSASSSSIRVSLNNSDWDVAVGGSTSQKSAIVPNGYYYRLFNDNWNIYDWLELR